MLMMDLLVLQKAEESPYVVGGAPEAQPSAQGSQNTRYHSSGDADRTSHVDLTYGSTGSSSSSDADKEQTFASSERADPKPGNRYVTAGLSENERQYSPKPSEG